MRHRRRVLNDPRLPVGVAVDDETAPNRIEGALGHDLVTVVGGEHHAVGVEGEFLVAMQGDVALGVEGDAVSDVDGLLRPDPVDGVGALPWVAGFGVLAE